jgi:hypothetical protein
MIAEMVIICFFRSLMMDSLVVPCAADKYRTRDLLFLAHPLNFVGERPTSRIYFGNRVAPSHKPRGISLVGDV